jgi:pyruvate/2-oxoglutarate dehydrogenase complex dihydrolipoamide acyltransferase (E2) component
LGALNIMATTIEVRVPDIGDFKNIPVIEMLVKPGDSVKEEQAIVTLESDKATLDVPTPVAGRVASLAVGQGTRVSQGSLILTLEVGNAAESQASQVPPAAPATAVLPVDSKSHFAVVSGQGGRHNPAFGACFQRLARRRRSDLQEVAIRPAKGASKADLEFPGARRFVKLHYGARQIRKSIHDVANRFEDSAVE